MAPGAPVPYGLLVGSGLSASSFLSAVGLLIPKVEMVWLRRNAVYGFLSLMTASVGLVAVQDARFDVAPKPPKTAP